MRLVWIFGWALLALGACQDGGGSFGAAPGPPDTNDGGDATGGEAVPDCQGLSCPPGTTSHIDEDVEALCAGGGSVDVPSSDGPVSGLCFGHGACTLLCVPPAPCCGMETWTETSYACEVPCASACSCDGKCGTVTGWDCEADCGACGDGEVCGSDNVCVEAPPINLDDCPKPAPDAATCNPYCDIGCDLQTEHCSYANGGFSCMPFGSAGLDEACDSSEACAPGSACLALGGGPASCYAFCIDDEDCPEDRDCSTSVSFSSAAASFCGATVESCDLWAQDCSDPNQNCYLVDDATLCLEPTFEGLEGYPCTEWSDCAMGLVCHNLGCTAACSLDESTAPPGAFCDDLCPGSWSVVSAVAGVGTCD